MSDTEEWFGGFSVLLSRHCQVWALYSQIQQWVSMNTWKQKQRYSHSCKVVTLVLAEIDLLKSTGPLWDTSVLVELLQVCSGLNWLQKSWQIQQCLKALSLCAKSFRILKSLQQLWHRTGSELWLQSVLHTERSTPHPHPFFLFLFFTIFALVSLHLILTFWL